MKDALVIPVAPGDPHWARFVDELTSAGLPTADLITDGQRFFAMLIGGRPVAYGGFALFGTEALLRSVVVPSDGRGHGVGRRLVTEMLSLLGASGAERAWLLTTSAADFFARLQFERRPRDGAPTSIASTAEFSSICPASAVLMCRSLA